MWSAIDLRSLVEVGERIGGARPSLRWGEEQRLRCGHGVRVEVELERDLVGSVQLSCKDEALNLQYKVWYARILDLKWKFLELLFVITSYHNLKSAKFL
ncbi:unnamed protein product [Calypogeia fissa]